MCLGGLGECSGEILEVFCHDRNLGFRGGERRRMVVSGFDEEHGLFSGFFWFSGFGFFIVLQMFLIQGCFNLKTMK